MKIAAVRADAPQSLQSAMMTLTGIRHYQTQSCCHVQSTVDCDPVDTQFSHVHAYLESLEASLRAIQRIDRDLHQCFAF